MLLLKLTLNQTSKNQHMKLKSRQHKALHVLLPVEKILGFNHDLNYSSISRFNFAIKIQMSQKHTQQSAVRRKAYIRKLQETNPEK